MTGRDENMMAQSYRTSDFDQAAWFAAVLIALFALIGEPFWAAGAGGVDTTVCTATVVLAAGLIALSIADVKTCKLPDSLTLPLLACGLLVAWLISLPDWQWHVLGALSGYAVLSLIATVYRWYRGVDGLGLGDAKLLAAGGAWLGVAALPNVLLLACVLAAGQVLLEQRINDRFDASVPIPFGPALSLGIWLVWLYGPLGALQH